MVSELLSSIYHNIAQVLNQNSSFEYVRHILDLFQGSDVKNVEISNYSACLTWCMCF